MSFKTHLKIEFLKPFSGSGKCLKNKAMSPPDIEVLLTYPDLINSWASCGSPGCNLLNRYQVLLCMKQVKPTSDVAESQYIITLFAGCQIWLISG